MLLHEANPTISAEGCLEFSIPGFSGSSGRIERWSSGFAAFLIRNGRTNSSTHCTLNLFPRQAVRCLPPDVQTFLDEIPPLVIDYVSQFNFAQCHLLRLLSQYPEARDLSQSSPTLLWLLTTSVYDSIIDAAELPVLLRKRQVEIVSNLAKPARKASLKLLRKVDVGNGGLTESRALLHALADPHMLKVTAHLPRVPVALLRAMVRYPSLANPSIARILATELPYDYNHFLITAHNLADTVQDIYRMSEALRIRRPEEAISRCRNLPDLEQLHDRWVDRVNTRGQLYVQPAARAAFPEDLDPPDRIGRIQSAATAQFPPDWKFPDPPLPNSEDIKAVQTPNELAYEGKLQNNCVGSYVVPVMERDVYIYKVLRPHRATLELRRSHTGWRLGQVKLSGNRVPGADVLQVVHDWLQKHAPGAGNDKGRRGFPDPVRE